MAAVWWLIGNLHVSEIFPGEWGDGSGVIPQVSHKAPRRGVSNVEHQQGFGGLILFTVQNWGRQRGQDELVDFQNKRGHERRPRSLVGNASSDVDGQPRTLWLLEEKENMKGRMMWIKLEHTGWAVWRLTYNHNLEGVSGSDLTPGCTVNHRGSFWHILMPTLPLPVI